MSNNRITIVLRYSTSTLNLIIMTPQRKIAYLTTRVTVKVQTKFRAKAARQGKMPATALREIAEAFVEDRLTIQPHQPK